MLKKLICLLMAGTITLSLLSGCGAKKAAADSGANEAATNYSSGTVVAESSTDESVSDMEVSDSQSVLDGAAEAVNNVILSQRKMIRNANITVEVKDFDVAYGRIETLISGIGIVQETNITKDKVYDDDGKEKLITKGIIVIRVDKDRFDRVVSGLKGLGLVTNQSISTEDVTDKFFNTESRIKLLKYEESRLLDYLKRISDPDTIFKTESRLTSIREEIESLTGTLNKMSELVKLSTITINMSEVLPKTTKKPEPKEKTYWQKLGDSFTKSFSGVVRFCGGVLAFIVGTLPVLALIGILVLLGWLVFKGYKRIRRYLLQKSSNRNNADKNNGMNV